MKIFKRLSAIVLVLVMILSSVGCLHKKNEIAVTIDGFEFTSAYYMCVLINARSEAQNKVYEELSTEEQQQEIDFLSKKIDKKSFTKWTEDRAMEMLKEIAAYKSLCKKADLKIDKEAKENAENTAASYWQYGYSQYFEPNGVSLETYKTYVSDALYSSTYFEYLYGNEGKKAIAQSEVDTELYDSFVTANIIEYTFNDESDSDKATIQTQFEAYLNDLKTGNATFEEIYKAHNNIQEDQEETTTEEDVPKDKYATIVGAEGTNYEHAYFDEIKNIVYIYLITFVF